MKRIFFILFIVLLFGGTLGWLFMKSMKKEVSYDTVTMKRENIRKKTMATGKIIPREEVAIKPQSISGIVSEIYVEEGQIIKAGTPVAKIVIVPSEQNLNSAKSRVKMARISLKNAETNYNRDKKLLNKKVIARAEFEKTELTYLNALEELKTAKNNLQITKTGASKNNKLSNTIIRSTVSGMVLQIPIKKGNSVIASNNFNDGTTIASIADMNDIIFEGKIDETDVAKLYIGMPIELTIGAINNERFDAVLEHISPKGEEEGGAVKFAIKAKVKLKKNQTIRAGYSANASITLAKRDSVFSLKESYIQFKGDSAFVEVLKSDGERQIFEKKSIKTGLSDGVNIEVVKGLLKIDKVKAGVKEDDK